MKCPDCEMEVDKLVSTTNTCMFCYKRYQNKKYKGEEYIPLVAIKGSVEYNRAMGKRLSRIKNTEETKPKKVGRPKKQQDNQSNIDNHQFLANVEQDVNEDIKDFFKKKCIKDTKDYLPLEIVYEWLYGLCQEDNYINDLDLQRQCFDTLIVNYMHELKTPTQDETIYARVGKKIATIQQRRTPIDNELDKYNTVKSVFEYLKNDSKFLKILQDNRIALLDLVEKQKDYKYISDTPSMQKYDFVVHPEGDEPVVRKISSPHRQNRYRLEITKVKNLYGNPNYQRFVYNKSIFADTEEEAKTNFLNYIKQDFPNLTFNTKDVVVKLYSEAKEDL